MMPITLTDVQHSFSAMRSCQPAAGNVCTTAIAGQVHVPRRAKRTLLKNRRDCCGAQRALLGGTTGRGCAALLLGSAAGCRCWALLLGAAAAGRCWALLVRCCWALLLGVAAGRCCCALLLGAASGRCCAALLQRRWIGVSTRTEGRVAGQVDSADLRSGQNPSKKEAVKPSQDGRKTKSTTLFAAS